jgi:hypothetical protein
VLSRRRLLRAAALGAAASLAAAARAQPVPSFSEEARRRLILGNAEERERALSLRQRLLDEGEALLAAGRGSTALETFERAALMLHAADTELGIVRAHMATGSYRRALAFCAHAAGAHRDQPGGTALYAWLLHVGGQEAFAKRALEQAIESSASALLAEAAERLRMPWPSTTNALLQRPWRAAPFASGAEPASGCRCAGSAALVGAGDAALVPTQLLVDARGVWLRNGLGQTVRAGQAVAAFAPGLTVLSLESTLPVPVWQPAAREPFPGSPGSTIEYAPDTAARPAWPLTRQGFFSGLPGGAASTRPLGLSAPAGPRGGPVFDRGGHWAGVALSQAEGGDRLVPLAAVPVTLLPALATGNAAASGLPTSSGASASIAALDAVYEQALLGALQVIVSA